VTEPRPFDNLDSAQLPTADSEVPGEYRQLPEDFWTRPIWVVKVSGGRL
jgi:hypothetical protein